MSLPVSYFPPISWFLSLLRENAEIEKHENYVKQTLRNRCQIATAAGVQSLSVPIVRGTSRKITDILISDHDYWAVKHWHAIETAYGESAFFDYYADDIKPFFELFQNPQPSLSPSSPLPLSLFEHNIAIVRKLLELMDIDHELRFTHEFQGVEQNSTPTLPEYYQVFRQKQGFLPNLSILDLIFNLGPESACYLLK